MTDKAIRLKLTSHAADRVLLALFAEAPWHAKASVQDEIDHLSPLGITVSLKRNRPKRTDAQNAFYWLCIGILAKSVGMTPDEAHEAVLCEYHGSTEVKIGSRVHHVPKGRSRDLPIDAMGELIETMYRCAALVGCTLPNPE